MGSMGGFVAIKITQELLLLGTAFFAGSQLHSSEILA